MRARITVLFAAVAVLPGCSEAVTSPEDAVCGRSADCGTGKVLRGCPECLYAREAAFDLDACSGGLTIEEIERSLAIDARFLATLEPLADKTLRAIDFSVQVQEAPYLAFKEPDGGAMPSGFLPGGDGSYSDGNGVTVRLSFGKDYQLHSMSEPIVPSVFVLDSYLQGAVVTADEDNDLSAKFVAPGPLVELLGFGPNPPSPADPYGDSIEMPSQETSSIVRASAPDAAGAGAEYDVTWAKKPLIGILAYYPGGGTTSTVSAVKLRGAGPAQEASITAWSVVLEETLDPEDFTPLIAFRGSAELTVKGGAAPHRTTMWFDGTSGAKPVVRVECL